MNTEHVLYHQPVLDSHPGFATNCLSMGKVSTPLNFEIFMGKM